MVNRFAPSPWTIAVPVAGTHALAQVPFITEFGACKVSARPIPRKCTALCPRTCKVSARPIPRKCTALCPRIDKIVALGLLGNWVERHGAWATLPRAMVPRQHSLRNHQRARQRDQRGCRRCDSDDKSKHRLRVELGWVLPYRQLRMVGSSTRHGNR